MYHNAFQVENQYIEFYNMKNWIIHTICNMFNTITPTGNCGYKIQRMYSWSALFWSVKNKRYQRRLLYHLSLYCMDKIRVWRSNQSSIGKFQDIRTVYSAPYTTTVIWWPFNSYLSKLNSKYSWNIKIFMNKMKNLKYIFSIA